MAYHAFVFWVSIFTTWMQDHRCRWRLDTISLLNLFLLVVGTQTTKHQCIYDQFDLTYMNSRVGSL